MTDTLTCSCGWERDVTQCPADGVQRIAAEHTSTHRHLVKRVVMAGPGPLGTWFWSSAMEREAR